MAPDGVEFLWEPVAGERFEFRDKLSVLIRLRGIDGVIEERESYSEASVEIRGRGEVIEVANGMVTEYLLSSIDQEKREGGRIQRDFQGGEVRVVIPPGQWPPKYSFVSGAELSARERVALDRVFTNQLLIKANGDKQGHLGPPGKARIGDSWAPAENTLKQLATQGYITRDSMQLSPLRGSMKLVEVKGRERQLSARVEGEWVFTCNKVFDLHPDDELAGHLTIKYDAALAPSNLTFHSTCRTRISGIGRLFVERLNAYVRAEREFIVESQSMRIPIE